MAQDASPLQIIADTSHALASLQFWPAGVVAPTATAAAYKEIPDVAMDADPDTRADVYVNGVLTGVGGTGLSSPFSLGAWARASNISCEQAWLCRTLLYQEYKNYTTYNATLTHYVPPTPPVGALTQLIGGFHDVLTGMNGTPALPSYDTTTGLGTFDISKQFPDLPTTY